MTSRPRRTAELGELSDPRTKVRVSRIAQPIRSSKRSNSLEGQSRGRSLERVSNAPFMPSSALKSKRSISATPLRTPIRPVPYTAVCGTSEKERIPLEDKQWLQGQINKVIDYLCTLEHLLGKEFLQRGGLKTMSTKQFILIVNNLLNFIAGNRYVVNLTNYIDDIVKILSQIGYPYTINKSWLKTPTAPHAFNNIVALLGWLVEFVPKTEAINTFEREMIIETDELIDKDYAQDLANKIADVFPLWNNAKDQEFEERKHQMVDDYVYRKLGIKNFNTLEQEITKLHEDYDYLVRHKTVVKRQDEYLNLDKENRQKKKILANLEEAVKEKAAELRRVQETTNGKLHMVTELQKSIASIQKTISSQKYTIQDRDKFIGEVHHLNQLLASKKESILQLQELGACDQISVSRLIKKKIDEVTMFNNYLTKIYKNFANKLEVDLKQFFLDQSSEETFSEQIKHILPYLNGIKKKNSEIIAKYTTSLFELENELRLLTYEHDTVLETKLVDTANRCRNIEQLISKLDIETINTKGTMMKEIDDLEIKQKYLVDLNKQIIEEFNTKEEELQSLQEENIKLMSEIMNKGNAILDRKEKAIDELGEAVDRFVQVVEAANRQLKDI